MGENLLDFGNNDSVSCICLLCYTFIVAVISFWVGTLFRSIWALPNCSIFGKDAIVQLHSHVTFVSMSAFIRRKIKRNEFKIRNDASSSSSVYESNLNSPGRIETQSNVLIDSILGCYIFPWYNLISDEQNFPQHFKQVLQTVFNRLRENIQKVDRTSLAKEAIQIVHCHWNEYCSAVDQQGCTNESITKNFKFNHDYINNKDDVYKQYGSLVRLLLRDVLVQEINCNIFREFLSGILVKCFVMYYMNIACDPRWVNKVLIALISTGSFVDTPSDRIPYEGESKTEPSTPICLNAAGQRSEPCTNTNSPKTNKPSIFFDRELKAEEFSCNISKSSPDLSPSLISSSATQECPTSKENITGMESTGIAELLKGGLTPGVNTISAALGEILSSAALPLLPEGYAYCLPLETEQESLVAEEKSENLSLSQLVLPSNSCTEVQVSSKSLEPGTNEIDTCSNTITPTDSTQTVLSKCRHFSLNDYAKSKNNTCMEKSTVSLDENKTGHTVARQNEFDWDRDITTTNLTEEEKESNRLCQESEDFAATIAKLRSLLEQRESQTNLMEFVDDGGQTTDSTTLGSEQNQDEATEVKILKTPVCKMKSSPQISTPGLAPDTAGTWAGSLEAEKVNIIVDELEGSEAEVNCFFLNVLIAKTESCGDPGVQSKLYCIQYEGVYLESDKDGETQKFVLRTTTVKRRFADFLTLQNQLEGNPIWKPHLRGMKTPKKWLHISFTNQNAVNQRRAHLEHYLQQLCYHPVLGFCKELRQFMAYGEDGYQAFGMPPSADLAKSHKFEKLAKTFTEVFNTLKDAVPHFESDIPTTTNSLDCPSKSPTTTKRKKMIPSFLNFDKYSSDRLKLAPVPNSSTQQQMDEITKVELDVEPKNGDMISDTDPISCLENEPSPEVPIFPNLLPEFSSECEIADEEAIDAVNTVYPLAASLTQFLCDVLWPPNHKPHTASVSAFMSISGKSLENYIQESMDVFLGEDAFIGYLEMLTASLNEWSQQSEYNTPKIEYEHDFNKVDLKNSFKQKIPVWIRWMWGRSRSEETIDRLAGFFQHTDVNHDLLLSLSELIFSKLTQANSSN